MQACSFSEVSSIHTGRGMADTRSKQSKKVEQHVEEELAPLALEASTPIAMETLVKYLLESNKASERARLKQVEDSVRARKHEVEEADRKQEEIDRRREEAEARVEKRRQQDIIDAEERQEKRDAKRLLLEKEAREEKLVFEKVAREELRKQQIEDEQRVFEHQQEMMRLQANLGERADVARREESDKCRKRDKAVAGIQTYREVDDIEEYLISAEKKLLSGGIPEEEWGAVVSAKLTGKVGAAWEDLQVKGGGYRSMKAGLLSICGYTPKIAGDLFFGFRQEALKGMTADHLWRRGVQLLRRMVAPDKIEPGVEFSIIKAWIWAVVPRRTRLLLDSRVVASQSDLILALQDHLVVEGEKGEGQVAVFKGQHHGFAQNASSSSDRRPVGNCYKCGKPGHRMADCWQKNGSGGSESVKPSAGGSAKPIVCYHCGVEGHRSPQCPKKNLNQNQEKPKPKDGQGQARPVRKLWHRTRDDTVIEGVVNGLEVPIVLDSGATISVVPEVMVGDDLLTGEVVSVMAFQSKEPVTLPTARVQFKVKHLEWEEEVALAPTIEGQGAEVLCRFDVRSDRGFDLVSLVREREKVLRVVTRAEAQKQASENKANAAKVAIEKPKVAEPVEIPVVLAGSETVGTDKGGMAADRPVRPPESVPPVSEDPISDSDVDEEEFSLAEEEADDLALLAEVEDYEEQEEGELFCLKPKGRPDDDLVIPPVAKGSSHREELVAEVKVDASLAKWRGLADNQEEGFCWLDGLLYKAVSTHTQEVVHLMALPVKHRLKVLHLAHERGGHLGARKVKALIRQRFVWPEMAKEVVEHCRSCLACQKCKKAKARRVPLIEREILSEPFEVLAMDLVGPFPKGKGGYTHLLTTICMSSKWPEIVPLKTITARAVADAMMTVFATTGIPLQLLTDQGSQFVGSLVGHLCKDLNIDKVKTAPYHPECNGVVERMHGTLGSMLTKASSLGLDWVGQVPFALFALRSSPNRDTGFSPFELVFGHNVRTPLDILHQGWAEMSFQELNVDEWSEWLVARLEIWHDLLRDRGRAASAVRKKAHDKRAVKRTLEAGDLVWCRVPGMTKKLRESWHGPYKVVQAVNRVDYKVKIRKGRTKVLHINNLKKHHPRGEEVLRLAVVAEDCEEDDVLGPKLSECCEGFDRQIVEDLKTEFPEVFSDSPGKTKVVTLKIKTGDHEPVASHPHRVPDKLKEGVRREVLKLVEEGIAVPSCSPWASPIVPVPKKDGSVRICIDYRRLNDITVGDPFYMVTLEEILEKAGGAQVMSKLDLSKGFYQVEVEQTSQEKTAFVCPFGKFEFKRMPFGLKNAPALFQRCMEVVLQNCYQFSAPYIDDVLVFSQNPEEHAAHLRRVIEDLSASGLTVKLSKCIFGMKKIEYLGHIIGGGELAVPEHRAAAMAEYRLPKTKKQLRSFLGAAGYYRKFVQGFARMSSVLSPWTAKLSPSVVEWTEEGLQAFRDIKVSLIDLCVLTIPSEEDVFVLHCDASGAGVGATLNVTREGELRPAAYFSKQLQGAEKRYCATELEGLAIYRSINFFSHYLFGRSFMVVTDHKALVSFLKSRVLNRRLQGWMLQLQQFDFSIVYRPGAEHLDADALSRQAWQSSDSDPWKPAAILQREEMEQAEADELRAAPKPQVVGGDVGTSPTGKKEKLQVPKV